MSTLEKLLVLGVLILVGVILAISLFWSRPDAGAEGDLGMGLNKPVFDLPSRSGLEVNAGGGAPQGPASGNLVGGGQLAAGADTRPAGSVLLNVPVRTSPSPFVRATARPDTWIYSVKPGDTPTAVAKKLTGDTKAAIAISKANEDKAFVPGRDILIPDEIFRNAKNPAASASGIDARPTPAGFNEESSGDAAGTIATGPKGGEPAPRLESGKPSPSPKPAVAPEGESPSADRVYVVKRGENLRKIARTQLKSEKRWKEIQSLNGLKDDVIREGQKLRLPPLD